MSGKPFHFRGCGWSRKKELSWSKNDMARIFTRNDLFNKMFGKDALSYEFDKGLKRVVISPDCLPMYSIKIMIMHCGSSSFLQFWPVLLHCWNPFQLAAQLPATLAQSAALPQASHQAPLLALQIPVAALHPVSQWILKLPLFLNHQNLCLFMIYEFVLQMIVPEANLLPIIFRL